MLYVIAFLDSNNEVTNLLFLSTNFTFNIFSSKGKIRMYK